VSYTDLTASAIVDAICGGAEGVGEVTAQEVTRASLDAIDRLDGGGEAPEGGTGLHAFLQVFHEEALERAREIDAQVAQARRSGQSPRDAIGPLVGVPVAIKDNICLSWGKTTCASRILENYSSPYTATASQRLIDAGAIVVGKTNLDEFAMGSSTEHSAFGPTRNPWDVSRAPGGSSGGSAAAVAARLTPIAFGSETGGSIRQPAAFTGVVGIKPTYGRVSRWGLVSFASSCDQIGPFGRTVRDAALALGVISGFDKRDSTSANIEGRDFTDKLDEPVESLRIAVPRNVLTQGVHEDALRVFEQTVEQFASLGAQIIDVDLPALDKGIAAYYIVTPAEASSNLARYNGVRYGRRAKMRQGDDLVALYCRSRSEGFGEEVQRRIMLGTHVLSSGYYEAYYNTALKARRVIRNELEGVLSMNTGGPGAHAILTPTTPEPAFRFGEKLDDPVSMYVQDFFTVGANLSGLPAVSIPAGFAEIDGVKLPIGVQVMGPAFDEARMLRISRMLERAVDLGDALPTVCA